MRITDFHIGFGRTLVPAAGSPTVPGAPTIGSATAGNASASVAFTAPASNGGATITGYTATSTPGGLTGTGASSPITVSGLSNGTGYTFTVHASNSVGDSLESSASNSVTPSAASNMLVYANGAKGSAWQLDFSFGTSSMVFNDTTHPQAGHSQDLKVPADSAWQPVTTNWDGSQGGGWGADISAYTYLQFDLWTAHPTDQFDSAAHYDGDVAHGGADVQTPTGVNNISHYATLNSSAWTTGIKVPLSALGLLGSVATYKFFLRDNSGPECFFDNVVLVPGNTSWIYNGGQARTWNGSAYTRDASAPLNSWSDASVNATANYSQDPTSLSTQCAVTGLTNPGSTLQSVNVLKLTVTANGGMWKVTHAGFALANYDHLTFSLLPTFAGYSYRVQFYDTSGVAVGNAVDPAPYTENDNHENGALWTVYNMPLSAFGSIGSSVGGLSIKDNSGRSSNVIYVSGVAFYS